MFPIEEEAAVIDFCAEVDGRKIKTQVRKKEEAKQVTALISNMQATFVFLGFVFTVLSFHGL